MNDKKEAQILVALKRSEPKKKRVTFFITENTKSALATWCQEKDVTESGTIEEIIKATIPARYFKGEK